MPWDRTQKGQPSDRLNLHVFGHCFGGKQIENTLRERVDVVNPFRAHIEWTEIMSTDSMIQRVSTHEEEYIDI